MKKYIFKLRAPGEELHLIFVCSLDIRSAINLLYQEIEGLDLPWEDLSLFRTYYVINIDSQRRSVRRLDSHHFNKLQTVVKEFIYD